jgi:hypothetical protein
MAKYALTAYPAITLYAIAITASAGTAADGDLVFSGVLLFVLWRMLGRPRG